MAKVLIIESEATVAKSLEEAFASIGAVPIVTGDGAEALDLARKNRPDLIILCVELSRGSGYSVCNKLKKDTDLASIPLVLTSSQATEETFEQHKKLRTRAEAYLKKPYATEELIQVAAQYVDMAAGGAVADELEVSLDDVSVDADDGFEVSVEGAGNVLFGGGLEPAHVPESRPVKKARSAFDSVAAADTSKPESADDPSGGFGAGPATQILVSDAEAERLRGEVRQLQQKVQKLEQTLQENELEFNDRLLEESARARDSVDIKKKLSQLEREMSKYQQAAEKAQAEADRYKMELKDGRKEGEDAERERQLLSDKIGQLVDKVKSLAAERDQLQADVQELKKAKIEADNVAEHSTKVREKAKKAVDIAMQLLEETGMIN